MAQDLRELFKKDREVNKDEPKLNSKHKARFIELLSEELPIKKENSFSWLKVAASVAVLLAAGLFFFNKEGVSNGAGTDTVVDGTPVKETIISLGDLSPDLKKVERYYMANINLTLSELEVSDESKDMTNGFMNQLANLNSEYERLNIELNTLGPNDQTITALIKNLQLRLQLLQKLKSKLNELKTSKNEQVEII